MKRLVYISTARRPMMPPERDLVLRRSRMRNGFVGITGLLVIGGRRYLQALEGPDAAVVETYKRIRQDPRHFAIVTLVEERIEQRAFAAWAMGFEDGGYTLGEQAGLPAIVEDLVAPIASPSIQGYFPRVRRSTRRLRLHGRTGWWTSPEGGPLIMINFWI